MEKYGKELLAFSSNTSESGQFLEYGKEPLFLNIGAATTIWRGIDAGISARITLEAKADLDAISNLAGETQRERLSVNAEPSVKSIVSTSINWGKTFCRIATSSLQEAHLRKHASLVSSKRIDI